MHAKICMGLVDKCIPSRITMDNSNNIELYVLHSIYFMTARTIPFHVNWLKKDRLWESLGLPSHIFDTLCLEVHSALFILFQEFLERFLHESELGDC